MLQRPEGPGSKKQPRVCPHAGLVLLYELEQAAAREQVAEDLMAQRIEAARPAG